jgi:molybdopterin molybdotransferase
MTGTQRPAAELTSLDRALARLLDGVQAVAPVECLLADAVGAIAAGEPQRVALPPYDTATTDGWAMRAHDLVGASSYSPLLLQTAPVWVEAGDRLPAGCDCVLDETSVVQHGPLFEALAEAIPGEGVRRAGEDMAAGSAIVAEGRCIAATDLMIARNAGRDRLTVRRPHVRVVEVPAGDGRSTSAAFIAIAAREGGARVSVTKAADRNAQSIAAALSEGCDMLLIVGGSGVGRSDAAVAALAARGEIVAHGLALRPGRTTAAGRIGPTPAIVIPGAPSHALAAWLALARPVLDRLTMRRPRHAIVRPLTRKIASAIGSAELVLLKAVDGDWRPIATGDLPLQQIAGADAWLIVPAESEGYAAGAHVGAQPL